MLAIEGIFLNFWNRAHRKVSIESLTEDIQLVVSREVEFDNQEESKKYAAFVKPSFTGFLWM